MTQQEKLCKKNKLSMEEENASFEEVKIYCLQEETIESLTVAPQNPNNGYPPLTSLPAELFKHSELTKLILTSQQLKTIQSDFQYLQNLKIANFFTNAISKRMDMQKKKTISNNSECS